ncbi:MAG: orotidine-5'-phosphate decarboxylase [Candidatus Methylacidiphilales bacterium]|nr:orotidine-5'-phosphate decarboxylase [Candidatus Methylacidiphilales bacterium]
MAISPNQIILALDLDSPDEAIRWAERFGPRIGCYKVGLQLFSRSGPDLVRELRRRQAEVFLDLKLHDIPNTVAKAVEALLPLDLKFLTLHTLGGPTMIEAAVKAAATAPQTTLLGVTILTSLGDDEINQLGFDHTASGQAVHLARLAVNAGLRGLVCSPLEAPLLRGQLGPDITLVTPGVRPLGSGVDDQSRIATPRQALEDGASYIVIGRPILAASDPEAALSAILAE